MPAEVSVRPGRSASMFQDPNLTIQGCSKCCRLQQNQLTFRSW